MRHDVKNKKIRDSIRSGDLTLSGSLKGYGGSSDYIKALAQFETLVLYFNDDWFDMDYLRYINTIASRRELKYSAYEPYRCPLCKRPFSLCGHDGERGFGYLDTSLFKNIPLELKNCGHCDK